MLPHVLIVEDSESLVSAYRALLEAKGHRVSIAPSVAAAVERCTADPPDVMLLDLTLPDGNGLDALRALAAAHRAPRVTVALTGRDEPEITQRCLEAGCREVLLKPVPYKELLRRLGEWLA